ncbi:alpha-hydroxy-acid oxidizing protein [Porcincola sp. LCP21S3_C12]|uniref:alpha-hydroxy-acid oxidizing protein n=1 Tax=Porcincola sp. LCP21S3_C12 TaxID=3438798 RepID=UPI003F9E8A9F
MWVSNHGGRQLDGGPASIEVLLSIASAVDHRVPVIFDSGVRRGQHVFKALASGADLVAIGRPVIYGLNLGGAEGVRSGFEHLNMELNCPSRCSSPGPEPLMISNIQGSCDFHGLMHRFP